ncbi:MAG: Rid family hydrolase [Pseudomonadota bacterium]
MSIERWRSGGAGRSRTVAYGGVIWTVANASANTAGFEAQVRETLQLLDTHLAEAGSARTHLLSLQVIFSDIADRTVFEPLWQAWIGPDPAHWPQRACYAAALAPGLLLELVVVAAPVSAALQAHA